MESGLSGSHSLYARVSTFRPCGPAPHLAVGGARDVLGFPKPAATIELMLAPIGRTQALSEKHKSPSLVATRSWRIWRQDVTANGQNSLGQAVIHSCSGRQRKVATVTCRCRKRPNFGGGRPQASNSRAPAKRASGNGSDT
jgi:hypothetical protein